MTIVLVITSSEWVLTFTITFYSPIFGRKKWKLNANLMSLKNIEKIE